MPPTSITSATSRLASVLALASVVACTSGDAETGATDTTGGAAVAAAGAPSAGAPSAGAPECFARGATLDEARSRPSPLGELRFSLGGQEALLCYGRPSANGRTVMGQLVPYGAPWRLGTNEATAIHLPFAADVGGVALEPGVYSLYAVPGETEWEFVVNRQAERWGIPINDAVRADDVGSFRRPVERAASTVEQLEFTWEPEGETAGNLVMQWENTRVEIPVRRSGS